MCISQQQIYYSIGWIIYDNISHHNDFPSEIARNVLSILAWDTPTEQSLRPAYTRFRTENDTTGLIRSGYRSTPNHLLDSALLQCAVHKQYRTLNEGKL